MSRGFRINIPEGTTYVFIIGILSLAFLYYNIYIGSFALLLFVFLLIYNNNMNRKRKQEWIDYVENLSLEIDQTTKYTLMDFPLAMCILQENGTVKWYNKYFATIAGSDELLEMPFDHVMEGMSYEAFIPQGEERISQVEAFFQDKYYNVYCSAMENIQEQRMYALYFFDITEQIQTRELYEAEKPVIINIQVDSFDEVLSSAADEMRPLIEAELERTLKVWFAKYQAIFRKLSKDRFLVLSYERDLLAMEENKFSILDDIRKIEYGNTIPVTISMGIASTTDNLEAALRNSVTSLDLALGRGGDQAVIRRNERSTFYGGKSKAVEKRTRVKARIMAHALRDLINESDNVLIMGHHYPDLDALGSSVGLQSICRMLNKKANIVLDHPNSSVDVLYDKLLANENFRNTFVKKEEALRLVNPGTLLIVTDTHRPSFTEFPKLIELVDKIMLVDHHRRGEEFLNKAVLIYHETYASSSSEMVTELVQYIKDRPYIDNLTAEALLSGITLDTKNFTFKTGVRTFEAAAFLRKFGADTIAVKQLFQGDLDSFLVKAEGIKNAKILGGSIAITSCPDNLENPSLIAAQVSDELLNIRGVRASFCVARGREGTAFISARSLGDINVHLFMERLGGGGHIDTAGAQLIDTTTEEALEKVENIVMEYLKED